MYNMKNYNFVIERNVPYRKGIYHKNHTDAIRSLNVGESFFIPCDSCGEAEEKAKRIKNSINYLQYNGYIDHCGYRSSIVSEDCCALGIRVWREDWISGVYDCSSTKYTTHENEEWISVLY